MSLQLEYRFVLPKGFVDAEGVLHKQGKMRLSTAIDEILPLRDPRVRANEAYLVLVLLSRVITELGSYTSVTPEMLEQMFASDVIFLQDFYHQINDVEIRRITITCPECNHAFEQEVPLLGE